MSIREQQRGICSACRQTHALTGKGLLYKHSIPRRLLGRRGASLNGWLCDGSGEPPVKPTPPQNPPASWPSFDSSPPDLDVAMQQLVEAVSGFAYHGDRMFAIIDAIEHLRANPTLVAELFGEAGRREIATLATMYDRLHDDLCGLDYPYCSRHQSSTGILAAIATASQPT